MTTILFILSFALLAVAFFLIILLYLKITQLKDVEMKQERLLKEFENVITSYVMEIKEENEVFLNRIKDMNHEQKEESQKESIHIREPELTTDDLQDLLPSYSDREEAGKVNLVENEIKQETHGNNENSKDTIVRDIEHLLKLGLSYEEIAKKLNKGKTEIELLHKFRQNH
ncbi:hypothetical protein E1I69_04280 [Bacillus timonensis]|uniref:Swarming motility protein SwrB n=1 Tax=Bacillus timonensis TaxID=1033734 RepID=A0A4S3PY94_9BACI|nr:hypothetical protein [Bacillus timonensis]THE14496.1 hypothetical protein E1I69_04280 [Bacillus timonensis]